MKNIIEFLKEMMVSRKNSLLSKIFTVVSIITIISVPIFLLCFTLKLCFYMIMAGDYAVVYMMIGLFGFCAFCHLAFKYETWASRNRIATKKTSSFDLG